MWPTLFGSVGAIITTLIVIPIVARMSKVMGKKKAFLVSQGISIVGYILLYLLFVPGKPYLFLFALPFFSFGIGSLFTLMMSMTSDVIDIDELNTGKRREGSLGAIYWWMVKFGTAVAGLLSGLILSLVAFQSNAPTQTDGTMFWLRIFFVGIPILGTLTAIWAMKDYDVDEAKALEVRNLLDKRKTLKPSGYGSNNVLGIDINNLSREELLQKFPHYYNSKLDYSNLNLEQLNNEFSQVFNKGMYGICFSVFTKEQYPGDEISEQQIRKRLQILQHHTQYIRVFSSTHGHQKIPKIAKKMGFKVLMGAWIGKDEVENQKEIQSLIQLMKEGYVDLAAVGNEVLFRGDQNEEVLLRYIKQVKENTSNIPVSYIDVYYQIINHPKLAEISDQILINCYPYWEGAHIEYAGIYLQEMYNQTKKIANGKEIIIAETGWPSKGDIMQRAEPSLENLIKYYIEVQKWIVDEQVKLFYFSSFDESWKVHEEGWAGTSWGIWSVDEKIKFKI